MFRRVAVRLARSTNCCGCNRGYSDSILPPLRMYVKKGSWGIQEFARDGSATLADFEDIEKKSIARGLILNRIDHQSMIFPEFTETDDVEMLDDYCEFLQLALKDTVDSREIDKSGQMPAEVIERLGKTTVFGLCSAKQYGGLGLGQKAYAKVCEVFGADWSTYSVFANQHDVIIYAIEQYGTEEQKMKYLPKLISGQITGALCIQEEGSGQEINKVISEAVRVNPESWVINGKKTWVNNGKNADIYLVVAKPIPIAHEAEDVDIFTCYIVEKDQNPGIKPAKRQDTIGLRGVQIWDVEFDNVKVSHDSILGTAGNGFEFAMHMLTEARQFGFGAAVVGFSKRLIGTLATFCNETTRFEKLLADVPPVRAKVAHMALSTYALESLVYYMAGLLDEDTHKEMDIENSVVQRLATRILRENILSAIEIMGARAATTNMDYERLLRDAVTLSAMSLGEGMQTNLIGMSCVTLWADFWRESLSGSRNFLEKFGAAMRIRRAALVTMKSPKMKHYIHEVAHPSLEPVCRQIEATMGRFESVIMRLLTSFGKEVEDEHLIMERVVDCVTYMLVMVALTSRVTRSYSIGLTNSDIELVWATAYVARTGSAVKKLAEEMFDDETTQWMDPLMNKICEAVFEHGGYSIENPLKRNW